jgi:hypothetical protein
VAIVVVLGACSSPRHLSAPATPVTSTTSQTVDRSIVAVDARMVLPSRTIVSGSSMRARVVITNNTRRELHVDGCLSLFRIVLRNDKIKPEAAWNACGQPFTIPIGESSYPMTVTASYPECSQDASAGIPACGADGHIPPLPPGEYDAQFIQSSHIAAVPAAIPVRVVSPRSTRP